MLFYEDVRSSIVNRLNDATSGLDAQIVLINTARGESTPTSSIIDPEFDQMLSYQVFVDFGPDTESDDALRSVYALRSTVPLTISTVIKDSVGITSMRKQTERYIEAICKCLDGYKVQDNTGDYYCTVVKTSRTDNKDHVKQIEWKGYVELNVHINKL